MSWNLNEYRAAVDGFGEVVAFFFTDPSRVVAPAVVVEFGPAVPVEAKARVVMWLRGGGLEEESQRMRTKNGEKREGIDGDVHSQSGAICTRPPSFVTTAA